MIVLKALLFVLAVVVLCSLIGVLCATIGGPQAGVAFFFAVVIAAALLLALGEKLFP